MNYLVRSLSSYSFRFYCSRTSVAKKLKSNLRPVDSDKSLISSEKSFNASENLPSSEEEYIVPQNPVPSKIDPCKLPLRTKIDADTIALLERLSLVDCANKKGIETLEEAIAFADQILQVDTTGVEPLITVLEDQFLQVEEDVVSEGNCREEVLRNASKTADEYFVAPPGNIPLEPREDLLHETEDLKKQVNMSLKKILDVCITQGYLAPVHSTLKNVFKVGPSGALLLENLRHEWFNSMVINSESSVLYNANIFNNTYKFTKELCMEQLPFGVAETVDENLNMYKEYIKIKDEENDFRKFLPYTKEVMLCTMFVSSRSSTQYFHQWQRQRRMWWRKFSASPGRYTLTEIQTNAKGENVEIYAKYDWGEQLIESLNLFTTDHPCLAIADLQAKDGRKLLKAHYITSQISLPTMLINTLCDAYDEPPFLEDTRPLLRLHRKVAPYKISFAVASGPANIELRDLALYTCKQLRAKNVSCLYVPSSYRNTLESQWKHYDQLGVPYTILLNENTLKTGIVQLRSRETTIYEQVPLSKLVEYVELLFKNY